MTSPATTPSSSPSLVRNVITNWSAFLVSAVINLTLSPFVVHSLGDTAYGAWVLLGSMVGYLGLLDLGVRGAVMRYVAHYHAKGEHRQAGQLASAALTVFSRAALGAILLGVVLAAVVGRVFELPPGMVATARVVAIIGSVNVAFALVGGVFGGIVGGRQRFDYSNGIEVALAVLRAAGVVLTLKLNGGLVALAVVQLAVSALRLAADYWLSRVVYPELRISLRGTDREHLRLVLTYGLTSTALHVSGQVMLYSDSLVIGAMLPTALVTYFAIAANLADYGRQAIGGIARALAPMVSAIQAVGENARVRHSLLSSGRVTTLLIMPIAVTFIFRGSTFIGLWMGSQYAGPTGRVLAILAVFMTCHAGYQVMTVSMMAVNRHRGLIPVFVGDAVCNVALSVLLVPRLGIIGSALGTLIPQLVATLLVAPWYVRRHLGIPMSEYWLNIHVRPALAVVPFALASVLVERLWPASNLVIYFSQIVVILPFALLGAWLVALRPEERRFIAGLIPRRTLAVEP
jgi:O-antigen/teichoic acid export membrane protein